MLRRLGYFIFLIFGLFAASLYSPKARKVVNPIVVEWWPRFIRYDRMHGIEHIVLFAAIGFIALSLWRTRTQANWALFFLVATAVAIEYSQHRVYRIYLEWGDVRNDIIGLIIGYLAVLLIKTSSAGARPWR